MAENVFSLKHALVDTEGNLMEVKVTGANDSDLAGGKKLLEPLRGLFPRLSLLSSIVCMVAYPGLSWRDILIYADVPIGISS